MDRVPTLPYTRIPYPNHGSCACAQAMAIPFYIGANVAVDMAMGSVVKAAWFLMSPAVAY